MRPDPSISIIVAVAADNAIGRNGDLLYRLRPDMRHFRAVTMGHPVIMGRKTWESLPGALPGRRNMVVTRNSGYVAEGAETFPSLTDAIKALNPEDEAMIIGGEQIYRQAMPLADRLYLTYIDAPKGDADTFFPDVDPDEWEEIDINERADIIPANGHSWTTDPATQTRYRFVCLSRK